MFGEKIVKLYNIPVSLNSSAYALFFNYSMFNESELGKPVALMKLSEDHSDLVAPFEANSIK